MNESFRIVSLVPSLTETICDFGLQKNVVGCTQFCISPKSLRKTAVAVGGTKDPRIEQIISLKPTHILINEEENTDAVRAALKEEKTLKGAHIIDSFPKNLEDTIELVKYLGTVFKSEDYVKEWSVKVRNLQGQLEKEKPLDLYYSYFIWREPWMVAGDNTYISQMLKLIGLKNSIEGHEEKALRYPVVTPGDKRIQNSNILFFSSEPFPFKNRHIDEFKSAFHIKENVCRKIDGQDLSWYGTRVLRCLAYLSSLKKELSAII